MKIKSRFAFLAIGMCIFCSSALSVEAAATVESIQYESSNEPKGQVKIILQGKKLKDLHFEITEGSQETKVEAVAETETDSDFLNQILNREKEKTAAEAALQKEKEPVKSSQKTLTFEKGKVNKKLKVEAPLQLTVQGKEAFIVQMPVPPPQRWGQEVKTEFLPIDKKAGRKTEQLVILFTHCARPDFTPAEKEALKGKVVILDPGHGGKDVGAVGLGGTYEKDVNLSVALKMKEELKKWGAIPVLTREIDTFAMDELGDRVRFGTRNKGDVFVSLHSDAALNRAAKGFTVYYFEPKGEKDCLLARLTRESLKGTMQTQDRGIRSANFYVVKRNPLPSILIEMGFISHVEEEKALMDFDYQRDVVEGTVQGLAHYFAQEKKIIIPPVEAKEEKTDSSTKK